MWQNKTDNKVRRYSCSIKAYEHKKKINMAVLTLKSKKDKLKVCGVLVAVNRLEYFVNRSERDIF